MIGQIAHLYQSGLTINEVGTLVSRSSSYVYYNLLNNRILIRKNKKYTCNEDYFEIIDSEEKAYWLGFLAADGNIESKGNRFRFNLAKKDIERIESFKFTIRSNSPIRLCSYYYRKDGTPLIMAHFTISSIKMKADLIDKGVVPCKSLILKPPKNIPVGFISHWIRGYFDGDGCISSNSKGCKRVTIVGTQEVLEFIQETLKIGNIYKSSNSKAFRYRICIQEDVIKFANYIYKDASTFLGRKWERFK